MEKHGTLYFVIGANRVLVGSALILYTMLSDVTPLGNLMLLPLIGASFVLYGVMGGKPVPELIAGVIDNITTRFAPKSWQPKELRMANR